MKFVDVHCHLDFEKDLKKRKEILGLMREKGIFALSNTLNPKNYFDTREMFKDYGDVVSVCPGMYPQDAEAISDADFDEYIKYLEENSGDFLAIGEVGLDFHHTKDEVLFEQQVRRFCRMVELAIELDKPLLIHTRKAEERVVDILEGYIKKNNFRKFDLHCYTGKKKLIKRIAALGIYCSIPLIVRNTQSFQILVEEMPIRQLLAETDSPFLHPEKVANTPLTIPEVYEHIAKLKGYDVQEIQTILYRNYQRFTL